MDIQDNNIRKVGVERILNFTRHTINLLLPNDTTITIPMDGMIRVANSREVVEKLLFKDNEIKVNKTTFGNAIGLPPEREGTIIIVSTLAAKALKDRDDIYVIDEPVREGQLVLGCRALAKGSEVS